MMRIVPESFLTRRLLKHFYETVYSGVLVMREVNKLYKINDNMSKNELAELFEMMRSCTEETVFTPDNKGDTIVKPVAS